MYAEALVDASFLFQLVEVDRELANKVRQQGCPPCGGRLHVANYPRKSRGIDRCPEAFAERFSLCCGRCRKRCTPPSVRFLGRRVYVGLIVMLAVMRVLAAGASKSTVHRWRAWWREQLPKTKWWLRVKGQAPGVQEQKLPQSLLEQFEGQAQSQTRQALRRVLELLMPLTSCSCTVFEGISVATQFTQNMPIAQTRRDKLKEPRRQ